MNRILPTIKFLTCPPENRSVFARLLVFCAVASLLLIANPGFFSYDELLKSDALQRGGFGGYFSEYVKLTPGNEHSIAGRPVAYFVEGIAALFMQSQPVFSHLLHVLLHGLAVCLLFLVVLRLSENRRLAWVSSLLFLLNPLITFSVGWVEMFMDSLYVIFGLAGMLAAHRYVMQEGGNGSLIMIFAASLLAMLSKETAVVLPFMLMVFPRLLGISVKNKRLGVAFLTWLAPVIVLLAWHFSAYQNSFGGASAELKNMPGNMFTYFTYPFMPLLTEAHTWNTFSIPSIGIGVILHLGLLFMLALTVSVRAGLAYLSGYFLLLLPTLFLASADAAYLYGSGIIFSLGLAALLVSGEEKMQKLPAILAAVLIITGIIHALVNQQYLYKTGKCMSHISRTVESAYYSDGKPDTMAFAADPEAPGYVLARYLHDRDMVGKNHPVYFKLLDWNKRGETPGYYIMNCDCLVHKPEPFKLKIGDWGPQATLVNANPNPQADASVGFWMQVENTAGLGDMELLVDGKPAYKTAVQDKLITATFSTDYIGKPGAVKFAVRQLATGQVFEIGTFIVH